ncbi:M50 family metallopeptidase, partial [Georgenia sp. 10Sc9-8]|nr:M50 family metallopeptidase [Georgenia halotolerans]
PPSPAAAAGLRPGDEVVAWDGRAVDSWTDLSARIAEGGTDPVPVVVLRDGERRTLQVTPAPAERPVLVDGEYERDAAGDVVTETRPYVGIGPTAELVAQPLSTVPGVVADSVVRTFEIVLTLPQRLAGITEAVLGPAERDPEVVGLVGVGRIAGEIASAEGQGYGLAERTVDMLGMLASLNLALFAFNLVPLLPLDGGHVAGALWEGGRRTVARWRDRPDPGPVDVARALPVTYAVVALMVGMSLLLAYADIVEPVSLTG